MQDFVGQLLERARLTDPMTSIPHPQEQEQPAILPEPKRSLRERALRSSVLTFINHGSQQALRLGGNLILTRLLFPEAFGLMALVQSFLIGLEMFSDVGIAASIVHSKRGDDREYVDTAWTVQVIRGAMLWVVACVLAVPASWFYKEQMLAGLLPAVGLTSFLGGLQSTKMYTADRHLNLGRLVVLELGCNALGLAITILLAWQMRSVWALVIGQIIGVGVRVTASHFWLPGQRNRFHWDKECYRELRSFGQWIILSTALGYLVIQGDRLVLGRLLDVKFLGIYTVALTFSLLPTEVIRQVGAKVLFPSYSELMREHPEKLYPTLKKSRALVLAASWLPCVMLIFFGQWLIALYDPRYESATWMLRTLAVGTLGMTLELSYDGVLLATGNSRGMAILLGWQAFVKFSAMLVGYHLGGQHGVVMGLALVSWLCYPANALLLKKIGYWQPELDLPLIGVGALLALLAYHLSF